MKLLHKNKTIKTILLFSLLIVILSSCSGTNSRSPINYRIGYDGLQIDVSGLPKYPIKVGDIFLVQVDLSNKGAYDIKDGVITIRLEPLGYFESVDEEAPDQIFAQESEILYGRNEFHPTGGQIPAPYVYKYGAANITATYEQSFDLRAIACYKYETVLESLACVGQRTTNLEDPEPYTCDISDEQNLLLERGQGAPIAITSLYEDISPGAGNTIRPRFRFTIENRGGGIPYPSTLDAKEVCTKDNGKDADKIDFEIQLSADYHYDSTKPTEGAFDCGSNFYLRDDKLEVECTIKEDVETAIAYYAPLVINLKYTYAFAGFETITVRSPEYRMN